jgi:hypothetical protein
MIRKTLIVHLAGLQFLVASEQSGGKGHVSRLPEPEHRESYLGLHRTRTVAPFIPGVIDPPAALPRSRSVAGRTPDAQRSSAFERMLERLPDLLGT